MSRRHRKSRPRRKRPAGRRFVRPFLALLGLAAGFCSVWLWYLDSLVVERMAGRALAYPSRVYARPLELYEGSRLEAGELESRLAAAGYRRQPGAPEPGTWERRGDRFRIHRRAFPFAEQAVPAARLEVALRGGRVTALAVDGEPAAIERLDPALIGRIFPAGGEDRRHVPLENVPGLLLDTLLAVEDRRFREHAGLDLRGIARAAWANFRAGRVVQGGSTLTQQLVKNFFLTRERSYWRKLNEAAMALLLERRHDKATILEAYLNEIYLGRDGSHPVHGIGRGSEFWFGRPPSALEPHQLALLVGMIQAPSWYDPRAHPERARERRNQVLAVMHGRGLISAAEADRLAGRPLGVVPAAPGVAGRYPAFMDLVRRELSVEYREADLRAEGLTILTTLDPLQQRHAETALATALERVERHAGQAAGSLQGAIVLTAAGTGEVRALVGGRESGYAGFNRALDARRPVGSLLKPVVYLAALDDPSRYTLATPVRDEPVAVPLETGGAWRPENFDGRFHGEVPLLEALAFSYNAATVRLGMELGVARVVELLHELGVHRVVPAYPSLLLGATEFSVMEMAQAYQALANAGYPVRLRSVTAVVTADGERIRRYPLELGDARWPEAAYLVSWALQYAAREGTARALSRPPLGRLGVAGKTGTSDGERDSWFAGFTGDHLAVAWVGRDDNGPAGVTGATAALPVFAELMARLDTRPLSLDPPPGVERAWVMMDGPRRAAEHCEGAVQLPFAAGSAPGESAPCVERERGLTDWVRDLFGNSQ